MQFCGIIMRYAKERYLPWREISYTYINTEHVTVGVKQTPRYRRRVSHNQFSCSQPPEYRCPTPYCRPVITPDCAFMMIRWWWWYNERTRHFYLYSQNRRCLQVFLLISVNNPTEFLFYTQLSVMYCLFKTHWSSITNITERCCRLVDESDSDPTTQRSDILTEACSWLSSMQSRKSWASITRLATAP